MDSNTNEISKDIMDSDSAVPMASQNSATQIFLIKEELPNAENNSNQRVSSTYQTRQDQQRVVRITSHLQSNKVPLNRKDVKTTVISNEIAPSSGDRKQRSPANKNDPKSSLGPYICDKCKKTFVHEASLKAHVRRTYCQEAKSLVSHMFVIPFLNSFDVQKKL